MMLRLFLCCLTGYLLGSIPFGLVIGKVFFHKDIRKEGSGNPGGGTAVLLVFAALILWRHRANLRRVAQGTENRISWM
jgi:glycerol-3-phosphate acyltransferase PlsY